MGIVLKIDNYKCPKCGKEITVSYRVSVVKLRNGQELVIDGNVDPICECGSPMISEELLRVMSNGV